MENESLLPNSYNGSRFRNVALPWLFDRIRERVPVDKLATAQGEHWDYRIWVCWAAMRGFVYIWPDPPTLGLIARPVSRRLLEQYNRGEIPDDEILNVYDQEGEGIWMDFLWAPGQWNIVMKFLRATGKDWVGWQHKNTGAIHILKIRSFSPSKKDEVETPEPELMEMFKKFTH